MIDALIASLSRFIGRTKIKNKKGINKTRQLSLSKL